MQEYNKNNNFRTGTILLIAFLLGALGMFALIKYYPSEETPNVTETTKDVTITDTGIADAVEKIYNAVVTVETYKANKLYATGTGFVYKDDNGTAYIMTNNHVIENGTKIKVVFTNQNSVEATIIGSDKYADIAVLQVPSDQIISVASIGNNKDSRIGDTVFAVGTPIDSEAYSWSVTRGIISGKDRLVEVSLNNDSVSDWVMSVLQTDTAINAGNSGGPLANSNGEVIGVTSMKLASSSIEGMGFAIPIEDALSYAKKIESGEKIERPYLGVSMSNLEDIEFNESDITSGVYIEEVEKDSPAEKAGLQTGDIIVKLESEKISSLAFLKYQLYKHNIGDKIEISFYRDDTLQTTIIELSKAAE